MKRIAASLVAVTLVACGPPEVPPPPVPAASPTQPVAGPSAPTTTATSAPASAATPAPVAELPFVVPPIPGAPTDGRQLRSAPSDLEHVILKISHPAELHTTARDGCTSDDRPAELHNS